MAEAGIGVKVVKRFLIFEVSCLIFKISGQRFAKFAVDLNDAIR